MFDSKIKITDIIRFEAGPAEADKQYHHGAHYIDMRQGIERKSPAESRRIVAELCCDKRVGILMYGHCAKHNKRARAQPYEYIY